MGSNKTARAKSKNKRKCTTLKGRKRNTRKKLRGGGKIVLVEANDIPIMQEILNDYAFLAANTGPPAAQSTAQPAAQPAAQSAAPQPATLIDEIKQIIDDVTPKSKTTLPPAQQQNAQSAPAAPSSTIVTKDINNKLLTDITYKLYPFMLNVVQYLETMRKNDIGQSPNNIQFRTKQNKHEILALKTLRKIDLLKKPLWLDSLISYFRYLVGMGGNSLEALESMMYSENLDDLGKRGARVKMYVYPDMSDDSKINSQNCDFKNDKSRRLRFSIEEYNGNWQKEVDHTLNQIFFENHIRNTKNKDTADTMGRPLTIQENDILLTGLGANPTP